MALQWEWDDFWAVYRANPEVLQNAVDTMPDYLRDKSTKIQVQALQDAPDEIVTDLLKYLTYDAQIKLIR